MDICDQRICPHAHDPFAAYFERLSEFTPKWGASACSSLSIKVIEVHSVLPGRPAERASLAIPLDPRNSAYGAGLCLRMAESDSVPSVIAKVHTPRANCLGALHA